MRNLRVAASVRTGARTVACVLAALVAAPAIAALSPEQIQQCLLEALSGAAPEDTVASVRAKCAGRALSYFEQRHRDEDDSLRSRSAFLAHRPNYILPIGFGTGFRTGPGRIDANEFILQISLKVPLLRRRDGTAYPVYFAYTGRSWWQAYNSERSSPFREYNHAPELFYERRIVEPLGAWTLRALRLGVEHESNGRSVPFSRSWNRVFAQFDADRDARWWTSLRLWARIPESPKPDPLSADGDDNPDIDKYLGHGELRIGRQGEWADWRLMLRRSVRRGGKGAARLGISFPIPKNGTERARLYLQLFDGYGESLIDYNRRVTRLGIGVMLSD